VASGALDADHTADRGGESAGTTPVSGLTTHVLDLAVGRPAVDVGVRLYRHMDGEAWTLAERRTDPDGRARLLDPGELQVGGYRLAFEIGDYFAMTGAAVSAPPFLDVVVIDFAVADAARALHVPLLVSPYGYSTYRGS
jgi:5-hydroxyisourate hydrolase